MSLPGPVPDKIPSVIADVYDESDELVKQFKIMEMSKSVHEEFMAAHEAMMAAAKQVWEIQEQTKPSDPESPKDAPRPVPDKNALLLAQDLLKANQLAMFRLILRKPLDKAPVDDAWIKMYVLDQPSIHDRLYHTQVEINNPAATKSLGGILGRTSTWTMPATPGAA